MSCLRSTRQVLRTQPQAPKRDWSSPHVPVFPIELKRDPLLPSQYLKLDPLCSRETFVVKASVILVGLDLPSNGVHNVRNEAKARKVMQQMDFVVDPHVQLLFCC